MFLPRVQSLESVMWLRLQILKNKAGFLLGVEAGDGSEGKAAAEGLMERREWKR